MIKMHCIRMTQSAQTTRFPSITIMSIAPPSRSQTIHCTKHNNMMDSVCHLLSCSYTIHSRKATHFSIECIRTWYTRTSFSSLECLFVVLVIHCILCNRFHCGLLEVFGIVFCRCSADVVHREHRNLVGQQPKFMDAFLYRAVRERFMLGRGYASTLFLEFETSLKL